MLEFTGRSRWVNALCTVEVDGRTLLASGGEDAMVLLWDPVTGQTVHAIPTHHAVNDLDAGAGVLAVALTAGLLVIDLTPPVRSGPVPRARGGNFSGVVSD